jgi:uroporphyrin-3 C-methyltransferase
MTEQDNKAKTEKATAAATVKATAAKKPEAKPKAKEKEKAKPKPAKPSVPAMSIATPLATLALLIAAGSAAGGYYLWTQQQADAGARQQVLQGMNAKAAKLQESMQASLAEQNKQLEARLQVEQTARVALEKSLEQLHTELGRDRHAWTLAEVRYYLRLANTRLLLLADVPSALRALELADARVKALASPSLHKMRGLLSEEIAALKAVPRVDIEGASLSLIALAKQVEALPLLAPTRSETSNEIAKETTAPADIWDWRGHAKAIWAEMKTLVTIRRTDRPIDALLAPEQMVFLRHNLRLKLEAARLALLQKDTAVYQSSLTEAGEWLAAYFNRDSASVKALLEQLTVLAELELQPALPDISRSLAEVEALEEQQAKANGGK